MNLIATTALFNTLSQLFATNCPDQPGCTKRTKTISESTNADTHTENWLGLLPLWPLERERGRERPSW